MMDEVGDDERGAPRIDLLGYREVYVPATDMAEEGKLFAASCWIFSRSLSSVAQRFLDFSSSMFVLDISSCKVSRRACRS
jgi:hypothetical protein